MANKFCQTKQKPECNIIYTYIYEQNLLDLGQEIFYQRGVYRVKVVVIEVSNNNYYANMC